MYKQASFQDVSMVVPHAAATEDTTLLDWVNNTGRPFRLRKATYFNATGLTNHADNGFAVQVKKGSDVIASWSVLTAAQGAIPAGEAVDLVLTETDEDLVIQPGEAMTVHLEEIAGSTTLPAGTLSLHGWLI